MHDVTRRAQDWTVFRKWLKQPDASRQGETLKKKKKKHEEEDEEETV